MAYGTAAWPHFPWQILVRKLLGGNHSNRGVPLVMDFPLKPGHISIARISQATGELRLVLGQGEILSAPKPFSGTCGVLRLARPMRQFLDLLMHEGLEHHVSLVYGDYPGRIAGLC